MPDGKIAAEAFAVIRQAMVETGKLALGRVVLHTRERLLALEPRDKGIVAYSLRTKGEVRMPADYFDDIPDAKVDKNMLAIAEKIIEQQEGDFDPSTFIDNYEEALKALIKEKEKGSKPKLAPAPKDTKVADLMEALRASLAGAKAPARKKPAREAEKKPAPRRKPATRRKAS